MNPGEVYHGSDGQATTALYEALRKRGPIGHVAECLFRAVKKSARAKSYRGRYRSMSYDQKQSSMSQLVKMLEQHAEALGFRYGWKLDPNVVFGGGEAKSSVLYVDVPGRCGGCQISFHTPARGAGPDYPGEWDGVRGASEQRAITLAEYVLTLPEVESSGTVWPFGQATAASASRTSLQPTSNGRQIPSV